MELRGYDASGNEIWCEQVERITPRPMRNGLYYTLHLANTTSEVVCKADYLDERHPGWRDLLVEADDD